MSDDNSSSSSANDDIELANFLRRIGARNLASEIDYLELRNRIVEAQRWLDTHEAKLSYERELHDEIDKRLLAHQSALFDKAQTYSNFVVSLGYAGFFAIWNFVDLTITETDRIFIALLLGFSLFLFVVWTVVAMLLQNKLVMNVNRAIASNRETREDMLEAVIEAERQNTVFAFHFQRIWYIVFTCAVVPGFLAGAMLLVLLFGKVIGFDIRIYEITSRFLIDLFGC